MGGFRVWGLFVRVCMGVVRLAELNKDLMTIEVSIIVPALVYLYPTTKYEVR